MSTKENDPAKDPNAAPAATAEVDAASESKAAAADAAASDAAQPEGMSNAEASQASPQSAAQSAAQAGTQAEASAGPDAAAAVAAAEAAGTDTDTDAGGPSALPGQLPGEVLAARRTEMRLSIEELAARVKLAPRQLVALEANDFGSLPGMATTRGFIRSCAKALGLDPEPLLAMLAHEPNPALGPMVMRRPLPQPGFNGRRYAPSTSHRRSANKLSGLAAVVLIFVGLLAFVAWRYDWLHLPGVDLTAARDAIMPSMGSAPAEADAANAGASENPAADAAASVAAGNATGNATGKVAAPATSKAAAPAAGSGDAEVYAPAAPAPVPPAAPAATAATKPAASAATVETSRALELKLREDAWVEVMTQNGERKLVSRLMKAGSTERIDVSEPVVLIVGNAAGVDVTLRGQPVSLKAGTRDNVAKVNLK